MKTPRKVVIEDPLIGYKYLYNRYIQIFFRSQTYLEMKRMNKKFQDYMEESHKPKDDKIRTSDGLVGTLEMNEESFVYKLEIDEN